MNFDKEEKTAIFRVLEDIAKSDDLLQAEEMNYLIKVANNFNWGSNDIETSQSLSLKDAGSTLMKMNTNKKLLFKEMVIKIADSDGVIQNSEFAAILDTFLLVKE